MSEDYVSRVREMDGKDRTEHLKKIEGAFAKSKEYGDDKVQLAMQTYEMVSYGMKFGLLYVTQHAKTYQKIFLPLNGCLNAFKKFSALSAKCSFFCTVF